MSDIFSKRMILIINLKIFFPIFNFSKSLIKKRKKIFTNLLVPQKQINNFVNLFFKV